RWALLRASVMGLTIQLTKWGARTQPMAAPMTTEISELIMRLRSSLRCSKKVIAPAGSSVDVVSCELDSGSVKGSSRVLVFVERRLRTRDGGRFVVVFGWFFRRARNRFWHGRDHRVFRRARF